MQKALSHALFVKIVTAEIYDLPETDKNSSRTILSDNALTSSLDTNYYPYATLSAVSLEKTAIFATASKDDIGLLAVVFETDSETCYDVVSSLFDWVFQHFQYSDVLTTKDVIAEVEVRMATENELVKLRPKQSIALLIPNEETVDFDVQYICYEDHLIAPISTGTVLGEVQILQDDTICATTSLVAGNAVSRSESLFIRTQLLSTLLHPISLGIIAVILILLVLYIVSVIRYRKRRLAYLRYKNTMGTNTNTKNTEHDINRSIPVTVTEEASLPSSEAIATPEPASDAKSTEDLPVLSKEEPFAAEFDKIPKQDLEDLNDLFKDL